MRPAVSAHADITLANFNMLFLRHAGGRTERERHLPLGPLYLTAALERAGFRVDFRDYQLHECADPFDPATVAAFLDGSARVLGVSCMANLLPFTLLALADFRRARPDATIVLGGVGAASVEREVLETCPWVDVVARGEGEIVGPRLLAALLDGTPLERVPGVSFRRGGRYVATPRPPRVTDLDALPPPALARVPVRAYDAFGMITSRGCPYPCTFCSVAPVWDHETCARSPASVVREMRMLHEGFGADLFLFQDEFFVSGKARVMAFCEELARAGLRVAWKAFGRVNLTDEETMRAMAESGCCEIRYGIESGSDRVLERTRKGFTAAEAVDVVTRAIGIFDRTDCFYVWGFPFETLDDFHQTVFQMISFRAMGARILPSLLCLLPQTEVYREARNAGRLEFCPQLFPEYMITGHEVLAGIRCEAPPEHARIFDFIRGNPGIFPGFFHHDLAGNVLPKLAVLEELGFYEGAGVAAAETESCGAHSPRTAGR